MCRNTKLYMWKNIHKHICREKNVAYKYVDINMYTFTYVYQRSKSVAEVAISRWPSRLRSCLPSLRGFEVRSLKAWDAPSTPDVDPISMNQFINLRVFPTKIPH